MTEDVSVLDADETTCLLSRVFDDFPDSWYSTGIPFLIAFSSNMIHSRMKKQNAIKKGGLVTRGA